MISFSEAQRLVFEQSQSFGKVSVSIDEATGRVIAEKIVADRNYPPFNRAAMDGFAIKHADWDTGIRTFVIRETIFAGSISTGELQQGECYKIMTGAAVPGSADTIIKREDVVEQPHAIECRIEELKKSQHISKQGEDLAKDEAVWDRPLICTTPVIGLLAALGKDQVMVEKLPDVSIISTGNEVVTVRDAVNPVQIRNSNTYVLQTLFEKWHITPRSNVHVPDNVNEIEAAVRSATSGDIIIMCGGVSAGDADHVPAVLTNLGAQKIFHKVAIRPGKPIWFGRFPNGPIIFGLPGNPFSCMVTWKLFVEQYLSYCFGLGATPRLNLPLTEGRLKKNGLDEFFPVRITGSPSHYQIVPFNGSGDVTAALHADALAVHPATLHDLSPGTIVEGYPLS